MDQSCHVPSHHGAEWTFSYQDGPSLSGCWVDLQLSGCRDSRGQWELGAGLASLMKTATLASLRWAPAVQMLSLRVLYPLLLAQGPL